MNRRDYYEVLCISKDATDNEIKKAYRKLAIKYHPDRQSSKSDKEKKEAEENFKEATEAYEVLSDKDKRARYDQFGFTEANENQTNSFYNDFFFKRRNPFDSFFHSGNQENETNKHIRVTIDLEQAIFGCVADIKVTRKILCKHCNGTGSSDKREHVCTECRGTGIKYIRKGFLEMTSVCTRCNGKGKTYITPCKECEGLGYKIEAKTVTLKIPEGSITGKIITIPKMGDEGKNGFNDLIIEVSVCQSRKFVYEDHRILSKVRIPLGNAILGKNINVDIHNGRIVELKIPKGCQNEQELTLTSIGGHTIYCIADIQIPASNSNILDLNNFISDKTELENY